MTNVPGYKLGSLIYETSGASLYHAWRLRDGLPVILKLLSTPDPHPADIARLRHEYGMIRWLDLPEVVNGYELLNAPTLWGLLLEDFGGVPLRFTPENTPLNLEAFLKIAIGMSHVLGAVHARGVTHKNIKTSNFFIHPSSGQIKLNDFSRSTRLSTEPQSHPEIILREETLAYISPEQTGRVNRRVDYRTDLYSLGVSLYELLSGEMPFPDSEPVMLIHNHIALLPPQLHEKRSGIPEQLSAIIHRLLAKNADDRYQSCEGLASDLEECLEQVQSTGTIAIFPLGRFDQPDHFQLPQKLYGRDTEIAKLLAFYEQIAGENAPAGLVLVSGEAGTGKTALVHEIHWTQERQRTYFICGQFEHIQHTRPYAGLIQALQGVIDQVLTENDTQIAVWRTAILDALNANARIMLDVLPDLEIIIGPQPAVVDLPDLQARNRFHLVFQNFIRVFTGAGRTLVLFIDDLQWIDAASLDLLLFLASAPDQHNLLIIAGYRSGEVDRDPLLSNKLDQLQSLSCPVLRLNLSAFSLADLTCWLADLFHLTPEQAQPLARVVAAKTGGNPFFSGEFIKTVVTNQQMIFVKGKGWCWDLEKIQVQEITENRADWISANLAHLPLATRQTLQRAACLGQQFELNRLAWLNNCARAKVAADLWPAVEAALILPIETPHPSGLYAGDPRLSEQPFSYKFAHTRIQQTLYARMDEEERRQIHHKLGEPLWQTLAEDERLTRIFEIAYHWERGMTSGASPAEKYRLAGIHWLAGRQAKKTGAFQEAYTHFRSGLALLDDFSWQNHYDLTLGLHQDTAEAALASGNAEQCAPLIESVLKHGRRLNDQLPVYQVKIKLFNSLHRPDDALEMTLMVLEKMGIDLPPNPTSEDVCAGSEWISGLLANQPVEGLIDLPEMIDADALAALQMLTSSTTAAFNARPLLYNLISFERVRLSIQFGNSPLSPAAYASYGLYLCNRGEIEQGYAFGKLALKLVDKLKAAAYKARTWGTVYGFIYHWKGALRDLLEPFEEVYRSGLENGDFEFSSGGLVSYSYNALYSGIELGRLQSTLRTHVERIEYLGHTRNALSVKLIMQVVENMLTPGEAPWRLKGEAFDEDTATEIITHANEQPLLLHLYLEKGILSYWFYQYRQARQYFQEAGKSLASAQGQTSIAVFNFYDSLIYLAMRSDLSPEEAALAWDRVTANQQRLAFWAQFAPMNYQHKWLLVEAERARWLGKYGDAGLLYEQAVSLARENRYSGEEALINERAAIGWLECHQPRLANFAFQHAYQGYQQWGALAKMEHLEKTYPDFLGRSNRAGARSQDMRGAGSVQADMGTVDFTSLIKSLQALAGELVLDKLLAILMNTILENAGAQRGCLILEENGRWLIKATGGSLGLSTACDLTEIDGTCIAASIIYYVIHTRESIILHHAAQEGKFIRDPYIVSRQMKSLLCIPLLKQSFLVGVLYLENNLISGAFTPQRLEFLRLLAAQAVITIENARFYDTLEHKVAERTAQLQQEVTRRRLAEEQMQHLAITDPLTGLYNRRYFFDLLENELQRSNRYQKIFAVILFDIDLFKKINDAHGHLEGDRVLKTIADLAQSSLRTVDTLARYGGEEFVVLLPETHLEQALLVTERMRAGIAACEMAMPSGAIRTTCSFGVTLFDSTRDQTPDTLLERADRAMYHSKEAGRNQISVQL